MPTSQKPRKKFSTPKAPPKQLLPSGGPVLIYTPTTKSARLEPFGPEIKCKVSESGELLIKLGPEQKWYEAASFGSSIHYVLCEIILRTMLVDGVIFDYSKAAREEMPVADGPVPSGTDVGAET